EKGRDPRDFALIAYGGSGPVHAAALAEELGISTVLVPPLAGLFSAAGLLFARKEFHDVRFCSVDARGEELELLNRLDGEMRTMLSEKIGDIAELEWQRSADVRYAGQSWDIEVDFPGDEIDSAALAELVDRFEAEHHRTYGVRDDAGSPVVIRALRLAVVGPAAEVVSLEPEAAPGTGSGVRSAALGVDREIVDARIVGRSALDGEAVEGPLLVDEYDTTVVVPAGWS